MKAVILAGGKGTRISEESRFKPKPMITIGGKPILWHIMKWYEKYGITEFIICCGYKGALIKDYFINYYMNNSTVTFSMGDKKDVVRANPTEPWKVTLVDTGLETLTAGRILKVREYLNNETFMLTYGDGVADVNLHELLEFHKQSGKIVTITSTQPEGRFGALTFSKDNSLIEGFKEKARKDQAWVNMGFMVMNPDVFEYLEDGNFMLETIPFENLARDHQLAAYKHLGFWSPMDNMHDREYLQKLWDTGKAPWCTNSNGLSGE